MNNNNTTKWNSNIFRNQKTNNNNNIKKASKKNKDKTKDNKNTNEYLENLYDIPEDQGYDIEDDNLQEGIFEYGEFTGYGWNDPEYKGVFDMLQGGLADGVEAIYQQCILFLTLISTFVVDKCDTQDEEDKKGKKYEKDKKKNIKIVRKYVAQFFCVIISSYAVYNWYFVSTFRDPVDNKRLPIVDFLVNRKKPDGERKLLIDDLNEKKNTGGFTGIIFSIIFFFFEYTVMFFDDFNIIFLDYLPNTISKVFGRPITFVFIFFFLTMIFYNYIENIKDNIKAMLQGTLLAFAGLVLVYILLKIGRNFFSNPNEHYFSDFFKLYEKTVPSGPIGLALIMPFFLILNIIRVLILIGISMFTIPVVLAFAIIFFSFFSIILFSNYKFFDTFKRIDLDCIEDFKSDKFDFCTDTFGQMKFWAQFFLKTIFGDFLYFSLVSISLLIIFVMAAYDYRDNIQGPALKNNLLNYSYILIFITFLIITNQLGTRVDLKLKEAGIFASKKGKEFEFDESKLSDNVLDVINQKVEKLNNSQVENVFT